jgi:hypothetical protein
MALSKADILNGINNSQEVEIKALEGTLMIRPLSSGEWQKLAEIEQAGLGDIEVSPKMASKAKRNPAAILGSLGTLKFNVAKQSKSSYTSQVKAIVLALDCNNDKWTEEDVKKLPQKAIDEIYGKVQEISGIDVKESEIEAFLGDNGRADDEPA